MGFRVGPVRQQAAGMAPQGMMMGSSRPILDQRDFKTEKEYLAALKRQQMDDEEFGLGRFFGMAPPNSRWIGGSTYEPERWWRPKK